MALIETKKDKHFPLFVHNNPLRKLFSSPRKYCSYIKQDEIAADLGCGSGYFTFPLAERAGPKGRIYAVDSDEKAIRALERKATKRGAKMVGLPIWDHSAQNR